MNILFDLDGTLVDPKAGIVASIRYGLERLGDTPPPADELAWVIGPPLRQAFPMLGVAANDVEKAVGYYREHYRDGAMYEAQVYAGIPEALDLLLSAGHRMFIATAKPHVFARPILQHFKLARRFIGIYGPELDGTRDDKGELIAHILTRERLKPHAALMVGDRRNDVLAATRNNLRTLGVSWGYAATGELADAGVTAVCATPEDLPSAIHDLSVAVAAE